MVKGFREFLMRGNVVDLAVGIVIGVAFTAVVNAIVAGIINPVVAAIFGKPDLNQVGRFTIGKGAFNLGLVLTGLINFVLIAAAVYFLVVLPINALRARFTTPAEDEAASAATQVELLTQIRDALRARG